MVINTFAAAIRTAARWATWTTTWTAFDLGVIA
jgi:hypothetical protein